MKSTAMKQADEQLVIDIKKRMRRPIVMIGLMGAGKTRIGQALAQVLDVPFYDSDHEIEAAAGMKIPQIFEKFGEEYFRDGERRVLKRILDEGLCVLATGGGAVMNEQTAEIIWNRSVCIWLRADLDTLVERTSKTDTRPLLKQGDPREILGTLIDQRYPVYENADIVVDSREGDVKNVINEAMEKLDAYLSRF